MPESANQPLRIVYMGTPDFAVPALQRLNDENHTHVVLAISQPDRPAGRGRKLRSPPVIKAARKLGIPTYQPESINAEQAAEKLRETTPDLIVVAAYGQILTPDILQIPSFGCINIHASLLPRWRGAAPIHMAVRSGDAVTGISIMDMDEGLDTGPIYHSIVHMIRDEETAGTLHDTLATLGGEAIIHSLEDIVDPNTSPTPQPDRRSNYAPMMDSADCTVDFTLDAQAVSNQINGMSPWPVVKIDILDEQVSALKAQPAKPRDLPEPISPGEVLTSDPQHGLTIACGNQTAVRLLELKRPGKRAMHDVDLLNGFEIPIGTIINSAT